VTAASHFRAATRMEPTPTKPKFDNDGKGSFVSSDDKTHQLESFGTISLIAGLLKRASGEGPGPG